MLYEQGAVSPTQIIGATSSLDSLVVVVGHSEHARRMRRLFTETCSAVYDLADPELLESLRGISGITTYSEPALIPTARIAAALGLPGHTAGTARRLTDKQAQRSALRAAGVDATASVVVSDPAGWEDAARAVGLPAVVKPVQGVNSRNTVLIEDPVTAPAELARVLAAEGTVQVEEYLPGAPVPEPFGDYVSVETVVQDGDRCHLAVTGKLRLAPPFRECGQFWPARLEPAAERAVLDLTDRAVAALEVTTGVLHTELKLTPDGPRIIEVNGRIGGYVADLAARAGGPDLVEVAARIACGQRVELRPIRPGRVFFQFTTPAPVRAGTVGAVGGDRALRAVPGIAAYQALVRPGTPVGGVGTLDLNLITGDVPDHTALAAVTDTILDTVCFDFDFGLRSGPVRRTARDLVYGTGTDPVAGPSASRPTADHTPTNGSRAVPPVFDNPVGVPAPPPGRYSHVARLPLGTAGTLLLVSGQVAVDDELAVLAPGDVRAQSERIFEVLGTILAAHGATFDDVVNIRTYLTDIGRLGEYAAVRLEHLSTDHPPTSTTVEVSALFLPGAVIEVEVMAVVGPAGDGS